MTRIERLQKTGITRRGTPKSSFRYQKQNGRKPTAAELKRINDLKIPPAWSEVAINPTPNGRLQAVGKDAAGRWQYLYHPSHVRRQELKKFQRLLKFAEALPQMRTTVARHLNEPGLNRERVLACVLRILAKCFMRPGSQIYASENGSYGIATLRPKHVNVKGGLVEFSFPGKSGVPQSSSIEDSKVAIIVRSLLKTPGSELFKYQNGEGEFVDLKRRHINQYIKEVMGESFSAKDFRTWAGTLICACALAREGSQLEEKTINRHQTLVVAIKETAQVLGNTPAVCRRSYICPTIISSFQKGLIIENYFKTLEEILAYRGHGLHRAERALLKLLKRSALKESQ